MIRKIVINIEEIIVSLSMVLLVLLTFLNVFLRYLFGGFMPGTIQISGILFAWLTLIGASLAFKYQGHIRFDIIDSIIKKKSTKKIYQIMINFIVLLSMLFVIVYGIYLSYTTHNTTIEYLEISQMWLYLSLPVGFLFMFIRLLFIIIHLYNSLSEFGTVKREGRP